VFEFTRHFDRDRSSDGLLLKVGAIIERYDSLLVDPFVYLRGLET
jgi:hypothetical protein